MTYYHHTTLIELGTQALKQGKLDEAEHYYQQALDQTPDSPDAHFNFALLCCKKEQFSEAISHLKTLLNHCPTHPRAHAQLGKLLQHSQQLNDCIIHYEKQLELTPQHTDTLNNLAAAHIQLGDFDKARLYLYNLIEIEPNHLEGLYNLAATLLNLKRGDEALKYYMHLLQLQPEAEIYYNIGVIHMSRDRFSDAETYLLKALQERPNYLDAHVNLGVTYLKQEKHANAIQHYDAALKLAPDNKALRYILNALQGKQSTEPLPEAPPAEHIQQLFDQYAPYYDTHLTQHLQYNAPQQLFEKVSALLNTDQADLTILDLGCGTGLCGELFRKYANTLIGVDLSEKMIEVAKEKNIYDELHVEDVNSYLPCHPSPARHPERSEGSPSFDLIIACDVLSYIGKLDETFERCHNALKPGGLFAFSIEKPSTDTSDYYLEKSARFTHSKAYIEQLCQANGFKHLLFENSVLRQQKNKSVEGYLCVLEMPIL